MIKEPEHDEAGETPEDELKETPEVQEKEQESGTELPTNGEDSAPVPEAFQKEVMAMIKSCPSRECLQFIQDQVFKAMESMRKDQEFSTEEMPK